MVLDLITLALLLIFTFWGTKRGAVKMAVSALGYGVAVVAGMAVYRPISALLHAVGITEGLANKLVQNGTASLPGIMLDIPFVAEGTREMAMSVASAAVGAISFLAAVIMAKLVLSIISGVLGFAGSLPVIRQANGLLGGMVGFGEGVMVELLIFGVLAMLETFGKTAAAAQMMEGSNIAALLYNNNPLLSIAAGGMF